MQKYDDDDVSPDMMPKVDPFISGGYFMCKIIFFPPYSSIYTLVFTTFRTCGSPYCHKRLTYNMMFLSKVIILYMTYDVKWI